MNYTIPLKLSKDFMMKVHAHPLLAEIKGLSVDDLFYQSMWEKESNLIELSFGGLFRNQFNTLEELKDFLNAFDQLVSKHNIDKSHRDHLLYLIEFFNQDEQKQSVENNNYNGLLQSGQFLIDLYLYGAEQFEKMKSSKGYFLINDELTNRSFFSKKDPKLVLNRDDHYDGTSVQYHEFMVGSNMLRIPFDMRIDFNHGTRRFDLPESLNYEFQKSIITKILNEHKDEDSEYYQLLVDYGDDLNKLRVKSFQKHLLISIDSAMLRVGSVIQDYLRSFNPNISKVALAEFIWEYFALFKAYKIKVNLPTPTQYSELSGFYHNQKITKQSIRSKFKDVLITGYF